MAPGCGRAYDLAALASPYRKVLGIDFAQKAVDAAKDYLNNEANIPNDGQVEVSLTFFLILNLKKWKICLILFMITPFYVLSIQAFEQIGLLK